MELYFLRHGLAHERDEWAGDDWHRPLTEEGQARMMREAETLVRLNVQLDLILTSPLVRARQTAEIVARQLHVLDKLVVDERLAAGFGPDQLARILEAHSTVGALMLVGHEPDFSETVGALIGGGRVEIKKGSVARVDVINLRALAGELVWLLPPKVLAL